jgi:electron-transferring-flavoprotein dehydrogenase
MAQQFRPLDHQLPLPLDEIILREAPGDEAVPMDVLFVGAGPAGLSGAIELARLVRKDKEEGGGLGDVEIGVLEKAGALGQHNLSGAVVNPRAFRELFPDVALGDLPLRTKVEGEAVYYLTPSGKFKIPTPPTMRNHGNYVASICEIVRWLGEKAEGLGVNVFTGFPADGLLTEGNHVLGVRTVAAGLKRDGTPGPRAEPAGDISARVTVLSEGTRGTLTQAYQEWQKIGRKSAPIYALGVKEVWKVAKDPREVIHTMGWPLPTNAFGGSWMYPMGENLVSLGLVVGLDYRQHNLDVHGLLQQLKEHPLLAEILAGGEIEEWGAKTIPEGGFNAFPDRWTGDGVLVVGDAAGLVNVPTLKGIHYAMQSGIFAARAIFAALKKGDVSQAGLADYDRMVRESYIARDLQETRNMRPAFKDGFYLGGFKAGLMTLSKGAFPGGMIHMEEDAAAPREVAPVPTKVAGKFTISKLDAVYRAGNATRDDIPSHLRPKERVPEEVGRFYEALCPAGVYEWNGSELVVNAPNCVDCKATDVIGPRWRPREGGSGPSYKKM